MIVITKVRHQDAATDDEAAPAPREIELRTLSTDAELDAPRSGWKVGVVYEDITQEPSSFFISPDGDGRYFYDTFAEAAEDV